MRKYKTAPKRESRDAQRDEWLKLMLELGRLDREAYREVRAAAWARVAQRHGEKSPEQLAAWRSLSS
jgi:hypothetical protein